MMISLGVLVSTIYRPVMNRSHSRLFEVLNITIHNAPPVAYLNQLSKGPHPNQHTPAHETNANSTRHTVSPISIMS